MIHIFIGTKAQYVKTAPVIKQLDRRSLAKTPLKRRKIPLALLKNLTVFCTLYKKERGHD